MLIQFLEDTEDTFNTGMVEIDCNLLDYHIHYVTHPLCDNLTTLWIAATPQRVQIE